MSSRRGRSKRRSEGTGDLRGLVGPKTRGVMGGKYTPLTQTQVLRIDEAAREILTSVGMAEAPQCVIDTICSRGGRIDENGRLLFSDSLIEEALAGFQRDFVLYGRKNGLELNFSGHRVHTGTGGAAPSILDLETGRYRDSTLSDLLAAARVVDYLEHIHFFSRPLVARDMENDYLLDINTAFASLSGTSKHVFTSASNVAGVKAIAEICFAVAGSQHAFLARPFLSLNINHVVPPLRYSSDACAVMAEAARLGIPFHANTFGQLGASSPVTIAGTLAQTTAETLAGMIFGWCINLDAKITFGSRPMVTDLRSGAMTGGGGEQAMLMAAATQMARHYDLPDTCIAGATDSKVPDAQSGYEKSLSVTLAAQAGSNAITQAAGMHASLVGCALESYIIDNDMLGAILRSLGPLVVDDENLSVATIADAVLGDGHYLGAADTLQRMNSDFLYPKVADRNSIAAWEDAGSLDIQEAARGQVQGILAGPQISKLDQDVERHIRSQFDIRL